MEVTKSLGTTSSWGTSPGAPLPGEGTDTLFLWTRGHALSPPGAAVTRHSRVCVSREVGPSVTEHGVTLARPAMAP